MTAKSESKHPTISGSTAEKRKTFTLKYLDYVSQVHLAASRGEQVVPKTVRECVHPDELRNVCFYEFQKAPEDVTDEELAAFFLTIDESEQRSLINTTMSKIRALRMQVQGAGAEDSVQKYFSDLAKIVARNGLKIQDKVLIEKHLLYGIKPDVVKDDIRNRFQAGSAEDRAARHNLALFRKMLLSWPKTQLGTTSCTVSKGVPTRTAQETIARAVGVDEAADEAVEATGTVEMLVRHRIRVPSRFRPNPTPVMSTVAINHHQNLSEDSSVFSVAHRTITFGSARRCRPSGSHGRCPSGTSTCGSERPRGSA